METDAAGLTGGYSRAIDTIQAEYQIPLAEIMDTPLCRFRQMLEVITQRQIEEKRFVAKVAEWQTKNTAIMFSSMADNNKQARDIAKAVQQMVLPLADEVDSLVDHRSIEEVIEEGAKINPASLPTMEMFEQALG